MMAKSFSSYKSASDSRQIPPTGSKRTMGFEIGCLCPLCLPKTIIQVIFNAYSENKLNLPWQEKNSHLIEISA